MKLIYEGMPTKEDILRTIVAPGLMKRFGYTKELKEHLETHELITWIDDDGNVYSSNDLIGEDSTTPRGKIKDSGEDRDMAISKESMKEAVLEALKEREQEEAEVLNAAVGTPYKTGGLGSEIYYPHLDPDDHRYVEEAKSNLSLDPKNVLETIRREIGIEHRSGDNINVYHSPEAVWIKRIKEVEKKKSNSRNLSKDEREVLEALGC